MFYQNYQELTWEEIEKLEKENCCILLPVSSIEQHGRHLPVGTDDYILQMCMEELLQRENTTETKFLCLPKISIGQSAEHMTFPGTLSFSVRTYQAVIHDIVASVAKNGFKKLVFVNGHGGNTTLLSGFSQELNLKYEIEIYNLEIPAIYGNCNEAEGLTDVEVACEIHAGDIETSMLLCRCPELVHMEYAKDVPIYIEPYYNSWVTRRLSPYGTMGKPERASAQKGELMISYIAEHMADLLEKIALL